MSDYTGLYLLVQEISIYVLCLVAIVYCLKKRSLWAYVIVVGVVLVLGLELVSKYESLKNVWPIFKILASAGFLLASYGCYKEQRGS